jgi:hypothetical protein
MTLFTVSFSGCGLIRPGSEYKHTVKVKKRMQKRKLDKLAKSGEKSKQKVYDMQTANTQERMDYNANLAKQWRRENLDYNKPTIMEKMNIWFNEMTDRFNKPKNGLFDH